MKAGATAVRVMGAVAASSVFVAAWALGRLITYLDLWPWHGAGGLSVWATVVWLVAAGAGGLLVLLLVKGPQAPRTALVVLILIVLAAVIVTVMAVEIRQTLLTVDAALRS